MAKFAGTIEGHYGGHKTFTSRTGTKYGGIKGWVETADCGIRIEAETERNGGATVFKVYQTDGWKERHWEWSADPVTGLRTFTPVNTTPDRLIAFIRNGELMFI